VNLMRPIGNAFYLWRSEIVKLIPESVQFFFTGTPKAKALYFSPTATDISNRDGKLIAPNDLMSANVAEEIASLRKPVVVDVIIDKKHCFERNVTLPPMNTRNREKVIALDTQRATPFDASEIYWSLASDKTETGNKFRQFIFKRSETKALKLRLQQYGLIVRQFYIDTCEEQSLVDYRGDLIKRYRLWHVVNYLLSAAIIILLAVSIGRPIYADTKNLQELQAELALQRNEAVHLREVVAQSEGSKEEKSLFLSELHSHVLVADVLRELTIRLPDTVWLSSIQYNQGTVVFSGTIDGSAAELVLLIAQSRKLNNPRLSGQVSRGQQATHENFEITASFERGAS